MSLHLDMSGFRPTHASTRSAHYRGTMPPEIFAPQISRPRSTPVHNRRHPLDGERYENIYTWVVEQDFLAPSGKYKETHSWVAQQQSLGDRKRKERVAQEQRRRQLDSMLSEYDARVNAMVSISMQREADARRKEAERAKLVREEVNRIEERINRRRETERQKIAEERRVHEHLRRERRQTEQATLHRLVIDAWYDYETRWTKMKTTSEPLTFRTMPWPLTYIPRTPDDIKPHAISFFLLSPLHSSDQSRKDRIRTALLRWHPDRFQRLLEKVVEKERTAVEEGAGIVVRCLNDLVAYDPRNN